MLCMGSYIYKNNRNRVDLFYWV
ncbi:hypothetical protein MXB_1675 [Myxobolus squamalis]|nr:hypothetical protein MXB_1675 [Myxobolus squamalis]